MGAIHLVRLQNFQKTDVFYTLIRTHPCGYQSVRMQVFRKILQRIMIMIP